MMSGTRGVVLAIAAALFAGLMTGVGMAQDKGWKPTERWYTWSMKDKPMGYYHVTLSKTDQADAPILLKSEFVLKHKGKNMSLTMEQHCRADAWLTPMRIVSRGEGNDEFKTFDAKVTWQEKPGESDGALHTGKFTIATLPAHTVTDFAIFEIVRSFPPAQAETLAFNSLEASELNPKKNHRLAWKADEELTISGEKKKLRRYEQSGDGIHPISYWLDDKGELVRVLVDEEKEYLLSTEAHARQAMESAQ